MESRNCNVPRLAVYHVWRFSSPLKKGQSLGMGSMGSFGIGSTFAARTWRLALARAMLNKWVIVICT
jgi:hypothetical protein